MRNTASSLADIADYFEMLAGDQEGCMRWQSTKRGKADCATKAEVWRDAASILRNTTLSATVTEPAPQDARDAEGG